MLLQELFSFMPEYLNDIHKYWFTVLNTDSQDQFIALVLKLLTDVHPDYWYKMVKMLEVDIEKVHEDSGISQWVEIFEDMITKLSIDIHMYRHLSESNRTLNDNRRSDGESESLSEGYQSI